MSLGRTTPPFNVPTEVVARQRRPAARRRQARALAVSEMAGDRVPDAASWADGAGLECEVNDLLQCVEAARVARLLGDSDHHLRFQREATYSIASGTARSPPLADGLKCVTVQLQRPGYGFRHLLGSDTSIDMPCAFTLRFSSAKRSISRLISSLDLSARSIFLSVCPSQYPTEVREYRLDQTSGSRIQMGALNPHRMATSAPGVPTLWARRIDQLGLQACVES